MRLSFGGNGSSQGGLKAETLTADLLDWAEQQKRKVLNGGTTEGCRLVSVRRVAPKIPMPPKNGDRNHHRRTAPEFASLAYPLGHAPQETCVRQGEFDPVQRPESTAVTVVMLAVRNGRHDQGEAFLFDDGHEARSFVQALVDGGLDHQRIIAVSGSALAVKVTNGPAMPIRG